jgi:hypothetical protein
MLEETWVTFFKGTGARFRVLVLVLGLSESAEPADYPARFVEALRVGESGS